MIRFPDGDTVGSPGSPILYDGAGRVKTIPGTVTSVAYNALGKATSLSRTNGTATTYGYSATRNWLTCINTTDAAGTNIQNLVYVRDAHGRISSVTSRQVGESWSYGYDELDRLLSANNGTTTPGAEPCDPGSGTLAVSQTFTHDSVGNMLTNSLVGSYNYPGQVTQPGPGFGRLLPHAMATAGGSSFGYDANGNMTSAAGDTLTYDGENRLASVNGVQFKYGPDGSRLKKINGASTTLYLGDDIEIAGGQMTKYLPGGVKRTGIGAGASNYWLHGEHLGSVRLLTRFDRHGCQPRGLPSLRRTPGSPAPYRRARATSGNGTTTRPGSCTCTLGTTIRRLGASCNQIRRTRRTRASVLTGMPTHSTTR